MAKILLKPVALLIAALSLGASYAHLLEAPPRLHDWPPELWREATVFHGQYAYFAIIGAPVDVAAIVLLTVLAWLARFERPTFWFAVIGAGLFLAGLLAWAAIVAPANAVLATWRPGPIPADFEAVRIRWEVGHMIVAALKLGGFLSLSVAATAPAWRVTHLS